MKPLKTYKDNYILATSLNALMLLEKKYHEGNKRTLITKKKQNNSLSSNGERAGIRKLTSPVESCFTINDLAMFGLISKIEKSLA